MYLKLTFKLKCQLCLKFKSNYIVKYLLTLIPHTETVSSRYLCNIDSKQSKNPSDCHFPVTHQYSQKIIDNK